jgi:hypothetical protein
MISGHANIFDLSFFKLILKAGADILRPRRRMARSITGGTSYWIEARDPRRL